MPQNASSKNSPVVSESQSASEARPGSENMPVSGCPHTSVSADLTLSATELTRVKRGPKRAQDDRDAMLTFIDQSLLCYVGFQINGQVRVIPTCHWREGDYLYWHGHSKAANIAGSGEDQQKVCITLSSLDGLVMARSAFHHSVNYRSVMVYGVPEEVTDPDEKLRHFELFVEKLSPGRWDLLRPVTEQEAKATGIMRVKLDEVSMKVRAEGVVDDEDDLDWPVWAGVLPIQQRWAPAEQDELQTANPSLPDPLSIPVLPDCDIC